MKLWLVGKSIYKEHKSVDWAFIGIFDDRQRALDACITEDHFMGKVLLNEEDNRERFTFIDEVYPFNQGAK